MSLEFRKIPNQEIQVSQLLYTTLTMQGREQRPSRPSLVHCNTPTLGELPGQRNSAPSENT